MNKNPHHLNTGPKLNAEERAEMRNSFMDFMEAHPPVIVHSIPSPYMQFFRAPAFTLATALLVLGGTAYASEQSLPTDFLYPVKTEILEPVFVTGLARSSESKARASNTLIERRLDEASELHEKGRLNTETSSYIAGEVGNETVVAVAHVRKVRESGNTVAALTLGTNIETTLEAHSEVLDSLSGIDEGEMGGAAGSLSDALLENVREIEEVNKEVMEEVSQRQDESTSQYIAESSGKAEKAITSVRASLARYEEDGGELVTEARKLLESAEQSYFRGIVSRDEGNLDAALPQFRYALQAADEAGILLGSFEEYND